nr:NUDIX hydrolase [Nocardioides sp.]
MAKFTSDYPVFYVTVDMAILTVHADALQVLLVKRRNEPYAGKLALPGGFVDPDEDLPEAARRELREETGLTDVVFEQL